MASCLICNQNSCWSLNLVLTVKHQTSSKQSSIQEHHLLVNFAIWSSVRHGLIIRYLAPLYNFHLSTKHTVLLCLHIISLSDLALDFVHCLSFNKVLCFGSQLCYCLQVKESQWLRTAISKRPNRSGDLLEDDSTASFCNILCYT